MKISEILLKYDTDKNLGAIGPHLGHYYGKSYDEIFDKFDKESNLNLLEIGIQKGGSISAWKDFFKNANVYGIDITDEYLNEYKRDDVNYIFSDVKDPLVKEKIGNIKFDIIIDDGSHLLSDVLYVVSEFSKLLNNNGVLIIEDCQNPEHWVQEVSNIITSEFRLSHQDLRHVSNRYDDFLIIIEKK